MAILSSAIDTGSAEFRANAEKMRALTAELQARRAEAALGGSEKSRERHVSRGKLLPRERVMNLIDPGSPFLELSPLAAFGMYDGDIHAAGIITGIGRVEGRECMIVANDATIKGGSYHPMTVKKHLRAQEIARENRLPCIYLVDSGGANLPTQTEVFPDREHFGRIFYNQAILSSLRIPQIAVVMGSCTAGGAYVPAMSDETIIVKNQGTIFLGGPPLVKAATGEVVSAEDLGGGDLHARKSGVADHLAQDDHHALSLARRIVANLNSKKTVDIPLAALARAGAQPGRARRRGAGRPQEAIRRARGDCAPGRRVGIRRVQAALRHHAGDRLRAYPRHAGRHSRQQRHFVFGERAEGRAFRRAVLPAPHSAAVPAEHRRLHGGQGLRGRRHRQGRRQDGDGGRLRAVPKITVIVGGSYGAGNYGMCGRAYGPRFLFMWPNARISVMGGEQASSVLATVKRDNIEADGKTWSAEEEEAFKAPIRDQYETEGNPYYATARLWDDGIIAPSETRRVLALAFSAALNAPVRETKFGVFRM